MISVIMGVYNNEKTVEKAVLSILNGTFKDLEFVIVDDGSTDSTFEVLEKLASENERIRLLKNDSNKGLAYSLNRCLEEAKGEYIARQDADDVSAPNRLEAELEELKEKRNSVCLTTADLARVIEIWTGIPTGNITEDEFEKIQKLEEGLHRRIIGQDSAISSVVRAIRRKYAGVAVKRKPVSFIFAGPTGVGKTELVKQLAMQLFDSPESLLRLDMSEYMEKHSVSRMIGSPPGYVGYDEAGQLTEKIRRKPYSVVLFDEIEKAHPDVLNILLQILDDGRITDAQGREVNFENTVIVMTTNAGSNFTTAPAGFGTDDKRIDETKTEKALSDFLRPEFINRIDEVITFNSLSFDDFKQIVRIMLSDLTSALAEKKIEFIYTDALCDFIVEKSYSKKFGARNMRRFIETNVEDKVAELLIESKGGVPGSITADVVNSEIIIK